MGRNIERIKFMAPRIIEALEEIDEALVNQLLEALESVYRAMSSGGDDDFVLWTMRNEVNRLQDKLSRLEDEIDDQRDDLEDIAFERAVDRLRGPRR